ncbi:formin-J [Lucilia cuprina]|uniref:formin-J n=1 Tax=Lucilia cuprina TaxID=7375 RepID=UPI001F06BD88|nr:formin-J [Lucilia cuprina]
MDSRIGLDYIVENRDYISKLGTALDTNNVVVKKQVFELLSALCAYNADGYARAIETLEYYKNLKNERYRFKIVINELEKTTTIEYQVALLAFINCVIISAATLQDRIRIRNEFIGLKILPLLNSLRKVAQSVGDIIVQLDVFDEQRECDEAQSLQGPNGINLNSHLDVFYAILRQVADTPQEIPFLSILQHLLRIDPKEPVSDVIWDTTEKLVHRATLLENHEDSVRLLRTTNAQKFTCQNCRSDATSPTRKPNGPIAPPPPPPPAPAPPAPPMKMCNGPPAPPPIPGAPPAPPPGGKLLNVKNSMPVRSLTPEPRVNDVLLPQQDTPAPKAKMKTLNWGKIPPHKVLGKQNLWTIVANNHQDNSMEDLDWNEMEGLFCLQSTSAQGSPKLGRADSGNGNSAVGGYDTLDRKSKKESTEINLLDGKRSLNVNIFLKQFKGYNSNEDIVQLIQDGNHEIIGAEKLRGLLKILPEVDEIDMLKTFNGDRQRLGRAEKFLLLLMEVPNYKLRIESMLLKEEFAANITYLDPCINAMIEAGDDLINNKTLQEVLYIVVVAGNFLNSGGYAGNAAGVKLSSLTKLTDIRANKPGMNLIHFVAIQAEKRNPALLNFTNELSTLENASKTNVEQISIDIKNLDTQLQKIKKQIELPNTDEDIKDQMMEFLESAESEISVLKSGMDAVESMRLKLADFFCEDPATFRLEECFKILQTFCDKFKQAVKENERRQQLEEQATLRQKQREEQLARRAKYANQNGTPISDYDNQYSLDSSFDARASPALSRKRFGSFNNGNLEINNSFIRMEATNGNCDGMSPDITPNGSMRRRRSRVLAEEDDLMEFLRTSGHERNSRERKAAYGSLDRSWARRARSGSSSRKRPELLNIDFGADRERAASPLPINVPEKASPLSPSNGEIVQPAQDETKPRISREWRQKIETWLQSNENDEKQDEEYKRKRRLVNINRRSLENESESERKLDTLPEEKFVPTTPNPCTNDTNNTNNSNNSQTKDGYKRVYPDWKPSKTLDTDVVGTIQAIADVNNARENSYKQREEPSITEADDVSFTKSSTLVNNVNKSEDVVYRRQRSIENNATQLESIAEEDRRKSLIQQLGERDATDRLKIYIRSPSTMEKDHSVTNKQRLNGVDALKSPPSIYEAVAAETASTTKVNAENHIKSPISKNRTANNSQQKFNFDNVPSSSEVSKLESNTSNKIHNQTSHKAITASTNRKEIDADNIETPPVTRRIISSPTTTLVTVNRTEPKTQTESNNDVENTETPGHFDRYSMARRTRRYKRPTDYSSGNEDLTSAKDSSEENSLTQLAKNSSTEIQTKCEEKPLTTTNTADKISENPKVKRTNISAKTITKLEKVGRHISSINQEDVQEALRNLKSPTDCPERLWSPPREIIAQRTVNCNNTTTTANGTTLIKISNHELNDEGFEETQSLVSDTPSHGKESTNSSCNEVNELPKLSQKSLSQKTTPIQKISSRLADRLQISRLRSSSTASKSQPTTAASSPRRTASSVDRARTARMPNGQLVQGPASSTAAAHMSNFTNNAIRRATSMRKTIANSEPSSSSSGSTKRDVERSSSRNSLRSSRSSINSGASTQTVKRMPIGSSHLNKSPLQTVSVDSSPSKRPLSTQNLRSNPTRLSSTGGVPASRSSSSGSSVGPNIVVVRRLNSTQSNVNQPRHTSSSNLGSTSFKENQTNIGPSSRSQTARTAVMAKANVGNPQNSTRTATSRSSSSTRGVSSFMRPTAASTTKRTK